MNAHAAISTGNQLTGEVIELDDDDVARAAPQQHPPKRGPLLSWCSSDCVFVTG
jgi:hypothetical protein